MDAKSNGVCPHCGRSDAVKQMRGNVIQPSTPRYNCGGCGSVWTGVRGERSAASQGRRVVGV